MDKNFSIVKVDTRPYRAIAQENWGLTDAQMKGRHVHHRIHRSDGGTNDPSNLYVCSPWYHDVVWHGGSGGFIELASEGGQKRAEQMHAEKDDQGRSKHTLKMHQEKDELGRSVQGMKNGERLHHKKDELGRSLNAVRGALALNAERDDQGRSKAAVKGAEAVNKDKDELGRSLNAVKGAEAAHSHKNESGKSLTAVKAARTTNKQIWESTIDGFRSNAGAVACYNKSRGWDPAARVRVG